ncbi:hypothetical protein QMO46_00250 [Microbacterium barkeri]|uniref:hypothetical protein n=1 Tax=Microbacterium barkeri TaxID=33917 RepID=UPI0024AF7C7A|nr:hypothetical protein [Microbacterium barkeri]MDI6941929.1 hypothetical protein [Microbacterium barkeri]
MSTVIEVEGETFQVDTREQPGGQRCVDFRWLTGPADGTYGFTVSGLPLDRIEAEAALFVRAFFAEDGIGPADFPDFVAGRA